MSSECGGELPANRLSSMEAYYLRHRDAILKKNRERYAAERPQMQEKRRAYYAENRQKLLDISKKFRSTPRGRYAKYRNTAKSKGLEFAISLDQFMMFWQKPCFYCGAAIETVGLDRKNNSLGYTLDNVESCCPQCNYFKLDRNQDDFLALCRSIAEHTKDWVEKKQI